MNRTLAAGCAMGLAMMAASAHAQMVRFSGVGTVESSGAFSTLVPTRPGAPPFTTFRADFTSSGFPAFVVGGTTLPSSDLAIGNLFNDQFNRVASSLGGLNFVVQNRSDRVHIDAPSFDINNAVESFKIDWQAQSDQSALFYELIPRIEIAGSFLGLANIDYKSSFLADSALLTLDPVSSNNGIKQFFVSDNRGDPLRFSIEMTVLASAIPEYFTFNGVATSVIFDSTGLTPSTPLLPTVVNPPGGTPGAFEFTDVAVAPNVAYYFDPPVAAGYDYAVANGSPLISKASFPTLLGDLDGYDVYESGPGGALLFTGVFGDSWIDFTTLAGYSNGISGFSLRGINPALQLDPTNPTAFVTGLEFASAGTVTLTQTPFIVNYDPPGGVPEPASWAMLIAGFGLTGAAMRRRRAVAA